MQATDKKKLKRKNRKKTKIGTTRNHEKPKINKRNKPTKGITRNQKHCEDEASTAKTKA